MQSESQGLAKRAKSEHRNFEDYTVEEVRRSGNGYELRHACTFFLWVPGSRREPKTGDRIRVYEHTTGKIQGVDLSSNGGPWEELFYIPDRR